LHLVHC